MLTVVVLSLLYVGSSNIYTTTEFKKSVKKYVKDRKREKAIIYELKDFKKEQQGFEKTLNGHTATFQKYYDDKVLNEEVIVDFFERIKTSYVGYYEERLDNREAISKQLTPEEWSSIVNRYDKGLDELLKARERRFKLLDKEIKSINDAIEESISDTLRVAESKILVNDIREAFHGFYEASNSINFIDSDILKNRESTSEEILTVYDEWNVARSSLYSVVIASTMTLTKQYSKEEWEIIMNNLRGKFSK
jgi:arsenate reductase-like glutaredoxin family protein